MSRDIHCERLVDYLVVLGAKSLADLSALPRANRSDTNAVHPIMDVRLFRRVEDALATDDYDVVGFVSQQPGNLHANGGPFNKAVYIGTSRWAAHVLTRRCF
jgi:hypothetical protein